MISRKVACAILVLNELYYSGFDAKTKCKTLRRTTLAGNCSLDDSLTFRHVMQQLRQCNYIAMRSNSVSVMLDPTELTIYDLFMVLPDGIPLGEETEHKHGEDYYAKAKYHHIKRLEDAAAASRT